ncbi:MAG: SDR family oxidoreductase [Bacillota bacterium]
MKILVTGASGLLGTDVALELASAGHTVIKSARAAREDYVSADIATIEGLTALTNLDWDCVVHTAAARDPDGCERDPEMADTLNVRATEVLARATAVRGAKFVFISTDYVFDGQMPPYKEDATPSPINIYGQTKLMAERIVLQHCPDALIIRVSILYGINAGVKASALLYSSLQLLEKRQSVEVDNVIVRYPVYTGDIAHVISWLLQKSEAGMFHVTSQDKLTKYDIAVILGQLLRKDYAHIKPLNTILSTPAARPLDAHLDTGKLQAAGIPLFMPFRERIADFVERGLL